MPAAALAHGQAATINPVERMKSIAAELTTDSTGELSEEQLERSVALLGARLRGGAAARALRRAALPDKSSVGADSCTAPPALQRSCRTTWRTSTARATCPRLAA